VNDEIVRLEEKAVWLRQEPGNCPEEYLRDYISEAKPFISRSPTIKYTCQWAERELRRYEDLRRFKAHAQQMRKELRRKGNYGRLYRLLVERDGEKCAFCGSVEKLQIDHIKPVSLGGTNNPENLQLLCFPCNKNKSNGWNYE
jgi:5-methylcytosine-specific restriction endonuclease McrA